MGGTPVTFEKLLCLWCSDHCVPAVGSDCSSYFLNPGLPDVIESWTKPGLPASS